MFTPIQVAVNVYTKTFCNIHSINVHIIYTDQVIVFTLFVISKHIRSNLKTHIRDHLKTSKFHTR